MTRTWIILIGMMAVLAAAWMPCTAQQMVTFETPQVKTYNGIQYVGGGIGLEEQQLVKSLGQGFPLKLIFALQAGNYLSDVSVTLSDGAGNRVLEAVVPGPWLYVDVPPGSYGVHAEYRGRPVDQVVTVTSGKTSEYHLFWAQ